MGRMDMGSKVRRVGSLLLCILLCEGIGVLGALFTAPAIPTWYAGLVKPFFSPPNWVFGPVWTLLYLLMGVTLHAVLWSKASAPLRHRALAAFVLQLGLNALWSPLFFGLRSPWSGFACIVLLVLAVIWMIREVHPVTRGGALLNLPYLVWVLFATALNLGIALMN